MAVLCRWILLLTLLLAGGPRLWAASEADLAFDAAVKAFQDYFYARTEAQCADFCQKYQDSPRLSEAILLQAQARIKLTNYAGAIELLAAQQGKAGTNADQYLFWLAEAYSHKGDWRLAGDTFARLTKEYPASSRCLEAALGEASARAALAQAQPAEWPRVIELLRQTNGLFQCAVRTNAASELLPRGYLLLSEAQLATKDYRAAEETLQPLTNRLSVPWLAWQRQYLLCRIQLADGQITAALQSTTNLLAIATNAAQSDLRAESAAFHALLFERLGQTTNAIAAYQRNLDEGIPPERQRQALLKITEWSLAQNNIPQATQNLERFLDQYPDAASADLALLTLGELRLRLYEDGAHTNQVVTATTNAPVATNNLQLAMMAFSALTNRFPQSPLLGKAQLNLGYCCWREGRLPEAQAAFQAALERLPVSKDLATAYFRLADIQVQQTNFPGAIKSYQAIIEKFPELPEVRTNLFEKTLYQTVRAGLTGGELASATTALQKLLAWYPKSLNAAHAVLLSGQDLARRGDPAAARKLLLDFDKAVPDAPLRAERQLAVATSLEQENKWTEAVAQYDGWLASFTNHEARARAEYFRAWDTWQDGRLTNALMLFTNFIAHIHPTNEFFPRAQMWVADYYYNKSEFQEAERNYKPLFRNTNCPPGDWTYQAQLMAGRAAVGRQGWKDAKTYFTNVYNNLTITNIEVRLEALFLFGDTLMSVVDSAETNKLANCEEATLAFGRICDKYPTNRLAIRAWGRRGDCYLQWALARQQYDSLTNALNAYQRVVDSPQADVALRSEGKVGLAVTLAKWAEQKTGKERTALLENALNHCLDVVYGKILRDDERLHAWWTKEAGVKAFDLAEALQAWAQEVRLYQRLTNTVWPQMPASMVKRAAKAQENLERQKSDR
jgi:TolA-binding protein